MYKPEFRTVKEAISFVDNEIASFTASSLTMTTQLSEFAYDMHQIVLNSTSMYK